jgi:hypothetical protein
MGEKRNAYSQKERDHWEGQDIGGVDNINMDLRWDSVVLHGVNATILTWILERQYGVVSI